MKTIKTLLILFLLSPAITMAQTEKYNLAMGKSLEALKSAGNAEQMLSAGNQFERIANAESKLWQPFYYSAYANIVAGIMTAEPAKKDELFDKAIKQVETADKLSVENSEIYALLGYAQFMKMSVDPQSRAMTLIPEASASLEKAKLLDPPNPRPWLISGQNTFYTPEAFGGGKQKAKSMLETAKANFDTFSPVDQLAPSWGKERCLELLKQCE